MNIHAFVAIEGIVILILEGCWGHLSKAPGMECPLPRNQWNLEPGDYVPTIKILGTAWQTSRATLAEGCIHNTVPFLALL